MARPRAAARSAAGLVPCRHSAKGPQPRRSSARVSDQPGSTWMSAAQSVYPDRPLGPPAAAPARSRPVGAALVAEWPLIALLGVAACLLFYNLGVSSLADWDEAI